MSRLFAGTPWDRPPQCERCGALLEQCQCPPSPREYADPSTQKADVGVERRKRGKVVTVVRGLAAADNDLDALLTSLKTHLGTGGSVQEHGLELQGDQASRVREFLLKRGYRV